MRLTLLTFLSSMVTSCAVDSSGSISQEADLALDRRLELTAEFGSLDGDVVLTDVRGIGVSSDGSIWIAEWDTWIHRVAREGSLIGSWHRKGQGPAEFEYLTAFEIDPARDIIVVAYGTGILTARLDLEEIARWRLPVADFRSNINLIDIDPIGGRVLWVGSHGSRDEGVLPITPITPVGHVIATSYDGTQSDTLGSIEGTPKIFLKDGQWLGRSHSFPGNAVLEGMSTGIIFGNAEGKYVLSRVVDGVTTGFAERALASVSLSASERAEFVQGINEAHRAGRHRLPAGELHPDDAGDLKKGVMSRALYDERRKEILVCRPPETAGGSWPVDVFSESGTYLGSLRWERCPIHIDQFGWLYFVEEDSLGVKFVRAYVYASG